MTLLVNLMSQDMQPINYGFLTLTSKKNVKTKQFKVFFGGGNDVKGN